MDQAHELSDLKWIGLEKKLAYFTTGLSELHKYGSHSFFKCLIWLAKIMYIIYLYNQWVKKYLTKLYYKIKKKI